MLSPAMAAAAAITGKLTDVRKFLGIETTEAKLKVTSDLDLFTDSVLPPPEPQQTVSVPEPAADKVLPSGETPSTVPPFRVLKGIAAPLHIENVDTDMIIPARYLKTLKRTGLADALFFALRNDAQTGKKTDFVINREPYTHSKILVSDSHNFGCGSSREHAPWAL